MRLNKFLAQSTELSRRAADDAIARGRVSVNGTVAKLGLDVTAADTVTLDNDPVAMRTDTANLLIMFNKPVGYVCSRNGQGSDTVFDLLPRKYHHLQPVGRLDKQSSGLLLLTDDGNLANQLTHPRYRKIKIYKVSLDKPLEPLHQQMISDYGIALDDGKSQFAISRVESSEQYLLDSQGLPKKGTLRTKVRISNSDQAGAQSSLYQIQMSEGRNRQIRRTFAALGYSVTSLHRTQFGPYSINHLPSGDFVQIDTLKVTGT